mgnify:CR=1 FL=1
MKGFLVRAKRATYADDAEPRILEDMCKELIYREGELTYRDRYYGSNPFAGQETVWKNGEIIWVMNYMGKADHKKVYGFLKKAMRLVDEDRPFRGPDQYAEGDMIYIDSSEGDLDDFKGTERIFSECKEIYRLEYHGGYF